MNHFILLFKLIITDWKELEKKNYNHIVFICQDKDKVKKKTKKNCQFNKNNFSAIVNLARKFLSAPASTVWIDGLFSEVGNMQRVSKIMKRTFRDEKCM